MAASDYLLAWGKTRWAETVEYGRNERLRFRNNRRPGIFFGLGCLCGITGKLISAVWDTWEHFFQHLEMSQKMDIYTLRRIVPKDRGMDWVKT
jgi:hypothetical protein